jgi:hypothetical protein
LEESPAAKRRRRHKTSLGAFDWLVTPKEFLPCVFCASCGQLKKRLDPACQARLAFTVQA